MPSLPARGDKDWRDTWAQAVHNSASEVVQGRLTDSALKGAFAPKGDLRAFNIYMPQNYGAVGNGVADDTAAVQAAIDAASGGPAGPEPSPLRYAVGKVLIPPGNYLTTSALVAKSVVGLSIAGLGMRQSRIKVSGSRSLGLSFVGCPGFSVENLRIVGDGTNGTAETTHAAFAVDWTPAQSGAWGALGVIRQVIVEDLRFKYGIAIGSQSANYDVSDIHLIDCLVTGGYTLGSGDATLWQAAYLSGSGTSGNVLNHHYTHCTGSDVRRLYHVNNVVMVDIDGGNCQSVDVALYYQGFGTVNFRNARVESSQRLAACPGGSANPTTLQLENVVWEPSSHAASDRMILQWYGPANVHLRGLILRKDSAGTNGWLFQFSTASQAAWQVNVFVDNIVTTNGTAESLFSIPAGTKCYAEVRGLTQNYSGVTGTYVGRKSLVYNGASGDSGTATLP